MSGRSASARSASRRSSRRGRETLEQIAADCIALKTGDTEMSIQYVPAPWTEDLGGPWSAGIGNDYDCVSLGEVPAQVSGPRRRTLRGALSALRDLLRRTTDT